MGRVDSLNWQRLPLLTISNLLSSPIYLGN